MPQAEPIARQPDALAEPLAVDAAGFARLLDISPSHFFELRAAGKVGPTPFRLGRSVRYQFAECRQWVVAGCPSSERWATMKKVKP
jgi:predicted DNA-binding transcriptional regulator AlpA